MGEKEHLHHIMAQMDGSSRVSNLRDVPVSPSMDATLPASLGRGKSCSQIAQQTTLHAKALNRAFFSDFHPRATRLGLSRLSASLALA